jgi:UPF0755 protein
MGRAVAVAIIVVLVIAVACGGAAWWALEQYRRPGPLVAKTTFIVPKGVGVKEIAARLADAGIIADPLIFRLGARFDSADERLRAGEYAFSPGISAREVVAKLAEGLTVVRRLTIPEGLAAAEVVALVAAADGLEGEVGPMPAEGSLLPETYYISYGDSRADLIRRMAEAMDRTLAELWEGRAPDLPFETPEEALILASIVEKETAVPEERPRVAAVFVNRLRKGMPLQSDPTVAYGLALEAGPATRALTFADLKKPTPYNTYLIEGLPPGPIANPGRAALEAALHPVETEELYFVADGTGGHAFARTLEEHNRNVANWRKIQKKARRALDREDPL